ncbi:MAG: peroxidase-related enzyme, partial [Coriobacteriia bacterium]|nr:peroxidase-related enzyme [Coriobacteriia bacterium]
SLKRLYDSIAAARGGVAEVHRAQSLNERALRAHLELYKAVVFQNSSLSRKARERIAVVVSQANGCAYCVAHHAAAARSAGDDSDIVAALQRGELSAQLSDPDGVLLSWARQGAGDPASCSEADVARLRSEGWDERAILDAALTVAYFAFVNRLVLMLGVDLEQDYERTCGQAAET